MTRRVRPTLEASLALDDARRWLRQPGSGQAGALRWMRLRDAGERLLDNPYLGARVAGAVPARQLAVSGYRLIYIIEPDTGDAETAGDIRIIAVLGPGQP